MKEVHCPKCGTEIGVISFGGWTFNENTRRLAQAPSVEFIPSQARLIACLLRAEGKILTREECLPEVSGRQTHLPELTLVDVTVSRIRNSLKPFNIHLIDTIQRTGYLIKERT